MYIGRELTNLFFLQPPFMMGDTTRPSGRQNRSRSRSLDSQGHTLSVVNQHTSLRAPMASQTTRSPSPDMRLRSTRVVHRLPRSSQDEVESTENLSRYTRESQTSQPGEDKKDIAEMIRLAAAKAPGLEVDHTLHIPVHPQGCAPCYNYSSHVIEVTGIDRNADQLSKYWKRHLREYISELRDVSYENGRRDGHRDNDVEIDRLQARVEELE